MNGGDRTTGLTEDDLPALFRVADRGAVASQKRYLNQIRLQLAMLLVGSVAGVTVQITEISELAFIGVAAYIVLVIVRLGLKLGSTDRVWYENRLIAESVRSLAWRYAVGGAPFSLAADTDGADGTNDAGEETDADALMSKRIAGLLGDVSHVPIPDPTSGTIQITPRMRELRNAPLEDRASIYETHRLTSQLQWYAEKAKQHAARANQLDVVFLAASGAAVFFGFLQAFGVIDFNLLGLCGIIAAIVATWNATTHYSQQAADYSMAAHQLTLVHTILEQQDDDEKWAAFVNDAEDGISREHTSWRVARAQA